MTIRDKRQCEFAEIYLESSGKGILMMAPRTGKCRTTINIFKKLDKDSKILIAYPDNKIKKSWEEEFKLTKWKGNITFTTHLSLHKYEDEDWDVLVVDEIHLLSDRQMEVCSDMIKNIDRVIGLTGTLTKESESTLKTELGLSVIVRYPIETAIKEGIITDYEIRIKKVPLNNKVKQLYKGGWFTEKEMFSRYTKVIENVERKGGDTKFLRLARMRVIQNSISKLKATQDLLKDLKDERVLVFCGLTKVADEIGCPVYHSKKGDSQMFDDFCDGKGKHMAVIKIGNTGRTYRPLDKLVINYFDSNAENLAQKINRAMAMEYNNLEKKAIIYIISTDEKIEEKWLSKALSFFEISKIKYVK